MRRPLTAPGRPTPRFGEGLGRHFVTVDPLMPSDWWAFCFTFLLCVSSLYAANGGGSQALFVYFASASGLVALFPHLAVRSLGRNALLLVYPAWLVLSIGWSTAPDRTVHEALLIAPTIVSALTLGGIRKFREVNLGGALGAFAIVFVSLVHGGHVEFSDTGAGGEALAGMTSGKNYFGHMSAMSALLSISFLAFWNTRYGRVLAVLGFGDMLISIYALLGSHATGSLLSFVLALGVLVVALLFPRVNWGVRVLSLAALAAVAVVYITMGDQIQQIISDLLLTKFNKDTTLTGRTVLWDYADRFIGDHRMLGYGYGAFWFYTNPDAWTIWRVAGVAPMSGFNFHNTIRETLIESGLIGLIIYLATYGWAFVRTSLRDITAGDLSSALRLAFICYFIVRMPVESTGFAPVTFDGTVLLAFLCTPLKGRAKERAAPAPTERRPALAAA